MNHFSKFKMINTNLCTTLKIEELRLYSHRSFTKNSYYVGFFPRFISHLFLKLIHVYTDHTLKTHTIFDFISYQKTMYIFTSSHCSKPAVTFQGAFPKGKKMGFYRYKS